MTREISRASTAAFAADLRNAYSGQSTGPLDIDRPWDAYRDDHLGLMDHQGIATFMVMGFGGRDAAPQADVSMFPNRPLFDDRRQWVRFGRRLTFASGAAHA